MPTLALVCIVVCVAAALLAAVWMVAYRVGFDEGRLTIPLRLIHALTEHKLGCLREHPDAVARELTQALALPDRESRRLIDNKLRAPAPVPPRSLRSA